MEDSHPDTERFFPALVDHSDLRDHVLHQFRDQRAQTKHSGLHHDHRLLLRPSAGLERALRRYCDVPFRPLSGLDLLHLYRG